MLLLKQKIKLLLSLLLVILATCLNLFSTTAQTNDDTSKQKINELKMLATEAPMIFEGENFKWESFIHEDGEVYTVHYIEVFKVFKGEVPDTVELITKGGWVHNDPNE